MKGITGKHFLLYFLSLFSISISGAQSSFFFSDQTVDSGNIFTADVKVTGFTDIVGVQYTITWDSEALRFDGLENMSLDLDAVADFGTNNTPEGRLTFVWYDDDLSGESLADSSIFFSIRFEAIGAPVTTDTIAFASLMPTVIEVTDVLGQTVDAAFINGVITIVSPTGTSYTSAPHLARVTSCFPNPFQEETQIQLLLHQSVEAGIVLQNAQGQVVHQERRVLPQGAHTLRFDKQVFPSAGTYFVQIRSSKFLVVQKLIYVTH